MNVQILEKRMKQKIIKVKIYNSFMKLRENANKVYICLPVYNEGKNLDTCIKSISDSTDLIRNQVKVIICLNACRDNSEEVAKICQKKYPCLNITIMKSRRGKINAQEKMLSIIPFNKIIFFIDSDTRIEQNSIKIIIEEFNKHKNLIAVGAFPMASDYNGFNIWKRLLNNTLNIRSKHPMCEISKKDVKKYHYLATIDSQKINTTQEHELNSKIFFHGRMFALSSKKYWHKPPKNKGVIGDDSYLPDYIIKNYGKNKIRIRYDAIVYFEPFTSIKKHCRAYKRIYFDLKNLKNNFPEFEEIRNDSELILDHKYIKKQKNIQKIYFWLFKIIRKMEKLIFELSNEKNPSLIWEKH